MPYTVAYEMSFINYEGANVVVSIVDKMTYTDQQLDQTIYELTPSANPIQLSVVDNEEDKFTPIRAKQATIKFLSDNNFNLNTFSEGEDDRWLVTIYINDPFNIVLIGFIVLNDTTSVFLDNYLYNEVTLNVTDALGLLKDILMTRPDGTTPIGKNRIIEYLSWCLQKTGLQLPINVMNSLMEESMPGQPAYNNVFIDAKSFEGDGQLNTNAPDISNNSNTSIDCYSVLEKILGESCYLTQWKGAWWIRRIDEYEDNPNYYDQYSSNGQYLITAINQVYRKNVGRGLSIEFIVPAASINFDRPHGFIQETFNYVFPKEIIDNIDFSRGNLFSPINPSLYPYVLPYPHSSDFPAQGDVANYYKANNTGFIYKWNGLQYQQLFDIDIPTATAYHIDAWTTINLNVTTTTPTATAYIERIFQSGYEKQRYVVFSGPVNNNAIRSNRVPVSYKDKFNLSVDRRLTQNLGGQGSYASAYFVVRLYGDNGTFWLLTNTTTPGGTPAWIKSNQQFTQGNTDGLVYGYFDRSENFEEWKTGSVEAPPIPATGDLEIYLLQSHDINGADTHFTNLQFEYIPFINGSYQKYNGQYSKVYKSGNLKANRTKEVFISDSPRKLFKGAIFKQVGGKYLLCDKWYNGAVPSIRAMNPVDPQYLHPLGFIQAYDIWNQYRRSTTLFDGTLLGLESAIELPDLMHSYYFTDNSANSDNKKFMLIHFDMDLKRCTWRGYFAEVYDSLKGKKYDDGFEFKYVES